ncbi:MAG: glycosyltransferase family 2 protein [Bacteroidaceae bacterium]|nr:glycosyltransferase family 2 protein [Bacteroidaceae bacterium]MBQ9639990.1 glycosyltransferase family 2 protein [Bacteroidaceae bacterium]
MKISVLIAIYNAEKYLRQCLDSLKNQSVKECQFICVDDCSTDSSVEIIKQYVREDSRFMLLHTPVNSGHSVARNLGLQHAEGEYITMLDADDWMAADAYEKALAVAERDGGCDCVLFRLMMYNDWDGSMYPFDSKEFSQPISGQEAFRLSLDWDIHGYYIIKRDIHLKYPYDATLRVYSDDNITTRLHYLHSRSVAFSDGIYYYRQHAESLTHKYSIKQFLFMDAFSLLKENILREIADGNIDAPVETLTYFENLRWINFLSMVRYYMKHRAQMTEEERSSVEQRLDQKLQTFEVERIENRFKRRFGYMPIKSWPLFRLQAAIFHRVYPLYRKLKIKS